MWKGGVLARKAIGTAARAHKQSRDLDRDVDEKRQLGERYETSPSGQI